MMNKTAIKNFAVWARNKLIADISYKAGLMGISEDGIKSALPQSTKDTKFYDIGTKEPYAVCGEAVRQRGRLADLINQKAGSSDYKTAYRSVIEEVAYTWFNRLIAIRFMEVNDYLPSRIRALSSESGTKLEPDLVTTPFDAELELSDYEQAEIIRMKNENLVDDLFRLLFVKQCNALNSVLPKLFEKTADYTELLLNVSVTDQDGVVYHLVHDIPEDDFNIKKGGQVEIIGWLYQYYNTEPKDEAFALLKKNVKITKERIPAATQLFTPDWIVRYMVENSLGRLWLEGHPNPDLKAGWKYYLDEAEQEADVQAQLDKIREGYKTIKPEDIKVIDPCMGSGHILVYAFDVLMQIYETAGYSQREAARSILENNIYGLDIDDRAFQLAYFAVMMKARQYNRRILNGETDCHVYAIQESNTVNRIHLKYFGAGLNDLERNDAMNQIAALLDTLTDAKEYGSILNVEPCNWDLLRRVVSETGEDAQMCMDSMGLEETKAHLQTLIDIGEVMAQKYEVVVTNPPYMGAGSMNEKLSEYAKERYPNEKSDFSTIFMSKCLQLSSSFVAMINIPVWMFLSTYASMREALIKRTTFINMLHFGRGVFGSDFGTTAFVVSTRFVNDYLGHYRRLFKKQGAVDSLKQKEEWFFSGMGTYFTDQQSFLGIEDSPFAYWASPTLLSAFQSGTLIENIAPPKQGSTTGSNDLFLRLWFEVVSKNTRWYPCLKGGAYRKWYGNHSYYIDWKNDGERIKVFGHQTIRNADKLFVEGISWSRVTISASSFRIMPKGFFFESASGVCFPNHNDLNYVLGLLNTKITQAVAEMINPTATLQSGDLARIPVLIDQTHRDSVDHLVSTSITISKEDWDSFETSWDFTRHPLMRGGLVDEAYALWEQECTDRFNTLKANEEELNRIFIDIYGLQDELTPEVADKDVTVRKADLQRDIKSLLSYAVGCMFGRYSLDVPGLAYAGGEWDDSKYSSFIPDKDNILPITDEEYFEDDIAGLFCAWLKKVYGVDTLEENLDFIAKALGSKGDTSRAVIRNYFLNDFFNDHCKTYSVTGSGKRPIYWLFDSGKQNGFKALIYMHRYDENTIGNLRIDYLHRMERVYDSEIARMQDIIDNSSAAREVTAATKRKEKLQKQVKECKEYDEKIAHLALARIAIDLDDGVKVNYEKVQTGTDGKFYQVLAKI